ncbi:MAG TPA: GGDEF domain-containing protein [Aquifex sp.]|nr:GGDEF domain-containing protein [Aquifex sp.]
MISPDLKLKLLLNLLEEISERYDEILEENRELLKELHREATTDHLTGLLNRRALLHALKKEIERIKGSHRDNLCICFMDMDNFKQINDRFGHQEGDRVLKDFALILRRHIRIYDIAGRWGGDEFIVGIVNCEYFDQPDVCKHCPFYEAVVKDIKKLGERYGVPLGVSCGVAKIPTETEDLDEALRIADRRLYKAKKEGKGKVVID